MENSNRRVLIWTASYTPVLGGLQTVCHQLAHGIAERGYQVMVLTHRYPKSLPAKEKEGRVRVERISHYRPNMAIKSPMDIVRYWRNRFNFPASRRQILSLLKSFQPHIINIHFPDPQLPYWPVIQRYFNGRLVVSVHGHDILRWFEEHDNGLTSSSLKVLTDSKKKERSALSSILREAHAITACSSWMLSMMAYLCPNLDTPKQAIYNAVRLDRFRSGSTLESTAPYLFAFGRLAPHKGFDLLIRAFGQLKKQLPHLQLLIGGEGMARGHLEQISQASGVSNDIQFCGRLSPNQIVAYAKGSEAIIIPSKREPFGISVLEGIASGRPVVATSVGGIPEAAGGLATLVPPTVDGLAQGILKTLQNDQLIGNSSALIERHLAQFTLERFIDQYEVALGGND